MFPIIQQLMEEFQLVQNLVPNFNVHARVESINKTLHSSWSYHEIDGIGYIKSSKTLFGKQYYYFLVDGSLEDVTNQAFLDVLPSNKTIGGELRLEFYHTLYQHRNGKDKQYKLKREIITPHIFFSAELRGKRLPEKLYKQLIKEHPFVCDKHTADAARLWEKVGDVTYFRFPERGEKGLQQCEKTDHRPVWKMLSVKSLSDIG